MESKLFETFKSLEELSSFFCSNQKCKDYLASVRWDDNPKCPYCHCNKVYRKKDGRYVCASCGNTFSVLVGTIFQNTKLPLIIWFKAIYLFVNSKIGISSCNLAVVLGVTQKTAWFMLQKIRILLNDVEDDYPDKVFGTIRCMKSRKNRFFRVRIANKPHQLHPFLFKYLNEGSRIFTDERICYQSLDESEFVRYHVEDPYPLSSGNNTIRNNGVIDAFWLQLKRMVMGVYHFISSSLFHRYIYEALFRYKKRRSSQEERFGDALGKMFQQVPYNVVRPK